jgi:ferredoxin
MNYHGTERWKLVVDGTVCDGHGICVLHCPDLVTLDEWGYAGVEKDLIDTAALMRRACRAVAACPEKALALRPVEALRDAERVRAEPRGSARLK